MANNNPVVQAILAGSSNAEVREAMLLGSYMESGWVATAVGDGGTSFGPFQEHEGGALGNQTPAQAENPATAVAHMLGSYTSAVNQVSQSLWSSNPELAAEQAAVLAERPAQSYIASRGQAAVNTGWQNTLAALSGSSSVSGAPATGGISTDAASISNPLSPSSIISGLASALGVPSPADLAERFGLIVLGFALILLGLYLLVGEKTFKVIVPGAQQASDAVSNTKSPTKSKGKTATRSAGKKTASSSTASSVETSTLSEAGEAVAVA
jgi:hypothetical protein